MLDNCSGGLGSKEKAESSQDCEYLDAVVDTAKEPHLLDDATVCLSCNPSDQNQLLDRVLCLCPVSFNQHDIRNRDRSAEPRDLMRFDNPGKSTKHCASIYHFI